MKSQDLAYDKLYDTFERKSFFSGAVVSISESCKLDNIVLDLQNRRWGVKAFSSLFSQKKETIRGKNCVKFLIDFMTLVTLLLIFARMCS